MKTILLFAIIISFNIGMAQEAFDIKNPEYDIDNSCIAFNQIMVSMPREVQFNLTCDKSGNIYFVMTSQEWFGKLFADNDDGLAVDIVSKDQYDCEGQNEFADTWAYRGVLTTPLYKQELNKNIVINKPNYIKCKVGNIPNELLDKELEFNILLLKNKYLCLYKGFINVASVKWELLETGLYMDTIVNKPKLDTNKIQTTSLIMENKSMKFIFPFEKNKYDYSQSDLKPLYDSLLLNDFDIKKIEILAYSSVEGPTSINVELQEKRANSILKALQSFQEFKIQASVNASENWVEFFNDIQDTKFSYMSKLSQSEIKEKLKNSEISKEIEPILKNHRKAILIIDIEKKRLVKNTPEQMRKTFEKSIAEKKIEEAIEIQQNIFAQIINNTLPSDFLNTIEIPETAEFSFLQNNRAAFDYLNNNRDEFESYKQFLKLESLYPNDGHIKYNIAALRFKLIIARLLPLNPESFRKEIENLINYKIPQQLVNRMLINYNIIMCEKYMYQGDYQKKDEALNYIYSNYKKIQLEDADVLSIAQYFSGYSRFDRAVEVLTPYVGKIDVDSDLLFYYINLTIADVRLTAKDEYRKYLLNARNRDKERFCKMFTSSLNGGYTFQLLEKEYLKKIECENCN